MIPDLFIWIEFRSVARKIGQRDCSLALFGKSLDCPRRVIGSVIGNDDMGQPASASNFFTKAINFPEFILSWITLKRMSPRGLTAEISFRVKRSPLSSTTGVCPIGAQVLPRW